MTTEDKLTYSELVNILSILSVRLERLEDAVLQLANSDTEQLDFLTHEILKARANELEANNKTPRKRLDEVEASLKGFIAYYTERISSKRKKKGRYLNEQPL